MQSHLQLYTTVSFSLFSSYFSFSSFTFHSFSHINQIITVYVFFFFKNYVQKSHKMQMFFYFFFSVQCHHEMCCKCSAIESMSTACKRKIDLSRQHTQTITYMHAYDVHIHTHIIQAHSLVVHAKG